MAWTNLAEEVYGEFALREGCMEPFLKWERLGMRTTDQSAIGSGKVRRVGRDEESRAAYVSTRSTSEERRAQNRDYKARLRSDPDKNFMKKAKARISRLKKRIAEWRTTARLIMIGRDLPTDQWMEVLLNPVSGEEVDAFTDFAYFLRHRGIHTTQIASMLGTTKKEIEAALSSRQ